MSVTFPHLRIGEPIRHEQLSVFPLFADAPAGVEYVLSGDAIAAGMLVVEEISEAGSVPTLSVTNDSDSMVLFLEGEELIGAKQNRILNTSILVGAKRKTTIPVSCVEQGRWRFKARHFGLSGTHSPSKVRYALKATVARSLEMGRGHRSDQSRVWDEVAKQQAAYRVASPTSALSDTFESYREKLDELRSRFGYVKGAIGAVVALGGRIVCLDLFDKSATCQKVWDRLLSGVLLDSLECPRADRQAGAAEVERFLAELTTSPWQSADAAGEGQEFRSTTDKRAAASALCYTDHIVHASAVAAEDN